MYYLIADVEGVGPNAVWSKQDEHLGWAICLCNALQFLTRDEATSVGLKLQASARTVPASDFRTAERVAFRLWLKDHDRKTEEYSIEENA